MLFAVNVHSYLAELVLYTAAFGFLRYVVVTIHVAGFQTVAIFMQTGDLEKSMDAVDMVSDVVKDSPNKVHKCSYL